MFSAALVIALDEFHLANLGGGADVGPGAGQRGAGRLAALYREPGAARRGATMIVAPLLGYAVDAAVATGSASPWWPAGVLGLACSLLFLLRSVRPDASSG
ncbi:MAG: hypothetical protein QGG57_01280 [Candidatus Poseidoniia archaeon]|nr:hypothetical protein [Candidatus Poseidoniia archaeon]